MAFFDQPHFSIQKALVQASDLFAYLTPQYGVRSNRITDRNKKTKCTFHSDIEYGLMDYVFLE